MVYPVPNRVPLPTHRPNPSMPANAPMGTIMRGPNGQNMQMIETTGMDGANGPRGWTPVNTGQPQQRRGLLDFAAQNPEMFLSLGAGLLGGQTGAEQWAGGLGNMAQTLGAAKERNETKKQKNATMEYLRRSGADPELIGLMETGAISGKDAYDYHLKAQTGKKPNFINAGDGNLFNADTNEWISAPGGSNKPLSTVGKINADFNAGLIDQATRDALIAKAAQSEGMEIVSDGQGGFTMRQGLGVGGKNMTESQAKANIYASRAEVANQSLEALEGQGTKLGQSMLSGVPVAGNYALTPEYQKYDQAKRDFVNAILRQESGAVIAEPEFANAEKQYFPQPGDSPQVIEQKRRNREIAVKAIREASGRESAQPQGGIIPAEEYFR